MPERDFCVVRNTSETAHHPAPSPGMPRGLALDTTHRVYRWRFRPLDQCEKSQPSCNSRLLAALKAAVETRPSWQQQLRNYTTVALARHDEIQIVVDAGLLFRRYTMCPLISVLSLQPRWCPYNVGAVLSTLQTKAHFS